MLHDVYPSFRNPSSSPDLISPPITRSPSHSPATCNKCMDEYGGSCKNRTRLILEIIAGRRVAPNSMPLFIRISGTVLCQTSLRRHLDPTRLEHGIDLLDVSSGGLYPARNAHSAPGCCPTRGGGWKTPIRRHWHH